MSLKQVSEGPTPTVQVDGCGCGGDRQRSTILMAYTRLWWHIGNRNMGRGSQVLRQQWVRRGAQDIWEDRGHVQDLVQHGRNPRDAGRAWKSCRHQQQLPRTALRFPILMTVVGRMLSARHQARSIPSRCLFPGGRFQLPARWLRGSLGQLQRHSAIPPWQHLDRLLAAGSAVQALFMRGPV